MNKADLVTAVSEKAGITKKSSEKVITAITEAVAEALANDEKVRLSGFGTFEVKERAARMGRNPKTKTEILIPPSRSPVFKPGTALRAAVSVG